MESNQRPGSKDKMIPPQDLQMDELDSESDLGLQSIECKVNSIYSTGTLLYEGS